MRKVVHLILRRRRDSRRWARAYSNRIQIPHNYWRCCNQGSAEPRSCSNYSPPPPATPLRSPSAPPSAAASAVSSRPRRRPRGRGQRDRVRWDSERVPWSFCVHLNHLRRMRVDYHRWPLVCLVHWWWFLYQMRFLVHFQSTLPLSHRQLIWREKIDKNVCVHR